jgi:hypothetical protein
MLGTAVMAPTSWNMEDGPRSSGEAGGGGGGEGAVTLNDCKKLLSSNCALLAEHRISAPRR